VSNGGEGYTTEPVVTINGNGTAATATAVVENGVLTAINADTTGSGYTNATVSIAAPPAPYVVDYSAGTVTVTYESVPTAGTEIVASYEANDSSIVGALSAADAHWLEFSVDGTAQTPRERVLSVPFAQVAGVSKSLEQEDIEPIAYQKSTGAVTVAAGETIEVVQVFQNREGSNYNGRIQVSVSGLGKTASTSNNLSLPFRVSGPTTVSATGESLLDPGMIYRIFDSDGSVKNSQN